MIHIPQSVYKLEIFSAPPKEFQGKLFSFEDHAGVEKIDISLDPFIAIKQACLKALGHPCALVSEGFHFFTELFVSLYEQLGLVYLEMKDLYKEQTCEFLLKQKKPLELLGFHKPKDVTCVLIGRGRSLLQDLKKLESLQKKVFLVSAYSALPDLEKVGITVDLAFASDTHQKKHDSKNARCLVIAPKTKTAICEGFQNVAYFPETLCQFSNYLFSKTPHLPTYGYTIMDHALKFLIQAGFQKFFLTGIDLEEMGGQYVDQSECGYKPDFKKAKEHLIHLMQQHGGIYTLSDMRAEDCNEVMPELLYHPIDNTEMIQKFETGLHELKSVDFQSLGLYEMFSLEQNPFYQVVLEPLYDRLSLIEKEKGLDKRVFFQYVLSQYQNIGKGHDL